MERCELGQLLFKELVKTIKEANFDTWQRLFFSRKKDGYWYHREHCKQCQEYTKSLFPF